MTTFRTPFSASSLAAVSPLGPPPTMMTSVLAYSPRSLVNPARIARVTSASDASPKIGMFSTPVTRAIPASIHKGWRSRRVTGLPESLRLPRQRLGGDDEQDD